MLETLYKTKTPEEAPVDKAEYYELILDQEQGPIRMAFEPHPDAHAFRIGVPRLELAFQIR